MFYRVFQNFGSNDGSDVDASDVSGDEIGGGMPKVSLVFHI